MDKQLMMEYEITLWEAFLSAIARHILGRRHGYRRIRRMSITKYKWRANLERCYFGRYLGGGTVGKYTYGFAAFGVNSSLRSIGAFCSIAGNQSIVPNDHKTDWVTSSPIASLKDFSFVKENCGLNYSDEERAVTIGNDVWIGQGCTIFEGVHIADGAVIAAGSIIRKDVPPYAIVGGVDRVIRYRFSEEIISKLLEIKWWNWSDEKIRENIYLMQEPEKFVDKFYKGCGK